MGERKPARRKPFRNIAGDIDANEEKRHAPRGLPGKRRQAMRHLFEARSETRRQNLDVVGGKLGRLMETPIRHHHGAGEIIGKRYAQQSAAYVVVWLEPRGDGVQKFAELAQGQLIGGLKSPARRLHDFRDHQLAAVMIVPAQPVAHDFDRQRPNADAMAGTQMFAQGEEQAVSRPAPARRRRVSAASSRSGKWLRASCRMARTRSTGLSPRTGSARSRSASGGSAASLASRAAT